MAASGNTRPLCPHEERRATCARLPAAAATAEKELITTDSPQSRRQQLIDTNIFVAIRGYYSAVRRTAGSAQQTPQTCAKFAGFAHD